MKLAIKFALAAVLLALVPALPQTRAATENGQTLNLTSPNGNEVYQQGSTIQFKWDSTVRDYQTTIVYILIYKLKGTAWDSVAYDYNLYVDQNAGYDVAYSVTDSGNFSWKIPDYFPPGQYVAHINVSYWNDPTANDGGILRDWSDRSFTIQSVASTPLGAHAVGTNVRGSDGTVYLISEVGTRSPYTSAGAFLSYKFNTWNSVVPANSADLALPASTHAPCGVAGPVPYYIPPRPGSLINDRGTVYLITDDERAGFASAQAFLELGYSFANVYPGDTSFMCLTAEPINTSARAHSDGTLVNDNGKFYIMKNGYRLGIPSMEVLDSWGYWLGEAVPANSYDLAAPQSGVLQTRLTNQLRI